MFSPRHLAFLAIAVALLALLAPKPRKVEFDPTVCAGPPLRSAQERSPQPRSPQPRSPRRLSCSAATSS